MTKDIIIEGVPLVDQSGVGDAFWKYRSCGVATLKMLLGFKNQELAQRSLDELISEGLKINAYIKDVGWRHSGLVDLAKSYGISLNFQKDFFKTREEKDRGLQIIDRELKSERPVAVSVLPGFNGQKDNHLLLVVGMRSDKNSVRGYHIQDPYNGIRGQRYFISREDFIRGWRGGMIYFANKI